MVKHHNLLHWCKLGYCLGDKQPLLSGYGTTYTQGTTTVIQQTTAPIVVVGGCPACRYPVGADVTFYPCLT